jgi:hypothetical protein
MSEVLAVRSLGLAAHAKLYRLVILDQVTHAKLYRTIHSRGFAHIVTDFRITFPGCQDYHWQLNRIWQRCTCDKFDAMLSQVMLSLQNLQALYFRCWCCQTQRTRHRYLADLPTKQLQKVWFSCSSMVNFSSDTCQILASPCMARITSLCLWGDCDVLSARSSLPHLKNLMSSDITLIGALLPKRTITHLSVLRGTVDFDRLHDIISQTSCSLTYLQVFPMGHTIPYFVAMDSTPYRSLKHLGYLDFNRVPVRDFSESL